MGVYIKGMEMPTDCIFCPMFSGEWTMCNALNKTTRVKGRPDDCPLVPVPAHGRLIDADALKPYMLNEHYKYQRVYDADEIANAPTILEAEEVET